MGTRSQELPKTANKKQKYKFKPKRIFIMAVIIVPFMVCLMALLLFQEYYFLNLKTSETFIRIVDAFKRNFSKK